MPVGVPLMAQVVALILKPVGKAGAEVQLVTVLVTVGVTVAIVAFWVKVYGLPA